MNTQQFFNDEELLTLLAETLGPTEREKSRCREIARISWEWRNIDEKLGELIDDSLVDTAGARQFDSNERALAWVWSSATLDLLAVANQLSLDVQVAITSELPMVEATISSIIAGERFDEVQQLAGGMCRFHSAPGRLTMIRFGSETQPLTTGWFRI